MGMNSIYMNMHNQLFINLITKTSSLVFSVIYFSLYYFIRISIEYFIFLSQIVTISRYIITKQKCCF